MGLQNAPLCLACVYFGNLFLNVSTSALWFKCSSLCVACCSSQLCHVEQCAPTRLSHHLGRWQPNERNCLLCHSLTFFHLWLAQPSLCFSPSLLLYPPELMLRKQKSSLFVNAFVDSECGDHRSVILGRVYDVVLGTELRALNMWGEHSTNWARPALSHTIYLVKKKIVVLLNSGFA